MKKTKEVKEVCESKKYYLNQFEYFDGECFVKFNIVDINFEQKVIKVAITDRGKITVLEFDLLTGKDNQYYFEYSHEYSKIKIDDFEEIKEK